MTKTYGVVGLFLILMASMAAAAGDKPAMLAGTGWEATGWYSLPPAVLPAPVVKLSEYTKPAAPGPIAFMDWSGVACGVVTRKTGTVEDLGCNHNLIVNNGKDMAIGDLFGLTAQGTANVWNQLAIGQNATPFAATDTALSGIYTNYGLGIATSTLTRVAVGNVSSVYTWTCSADGKTVTAVAMYNATNSILATEAVVTSATLNNGDKLTITYYGAQT
jgi:hypothetical protein